MNGSIYFQSLHHTSISLYITQYNPHLFVWFAMSSLDEYVRIWDEMVSIPAPATGLSAPAPLSQY